MVNIFTDEIWKTIPTIENAFLSNKGRCKKGKRILTKNQSRFKVYEGKKCTNIHIPTWMEKLFPEVQYNEIEPTVFKDLEGETWEDVIGWEGMYQVSDMNRARRLDSYRDFKDTKMYIKGGMCSISLSTKGYPVFGINIDREPRALLLHREVGKAFIPNPDNLPEINHKNGIKTDCRPSNLEWCTTAHNIQHAWDTGLRKKKNI